MNVRARLIAGFVGVSIFVLLLFGFVAHRAALDLELKKELGLAHENAVTLANSLAASAADGASLARVVSQMGGEDRAVILVSADGDIFTSAQTSTGAGLSDTSRLLGLLSEKDNRGVIALVGEEYIWAYVPLKGMDQTLLLLSRHRDTFASQSRALGIRLFVTAFIIIWLAVWIALMLSSRIVRVINQQNAALLHQALYDDLTDLPNRRHLFEFLADRIHEAPLQSFGVFVLDFDGFKEVNDTLGHRVGDELLRQSAERLRRAMPDVAFMARLGGDEFAVVVEDVAQMSLASRVIHGALGEPLTLQNMDITLECSSGAALYPTHANNAETLVQHAEVAMYHAKSSHQQCQLYDAGFDPHSLRRLALLGDLRYAVERNQMRLMYQPKVDLSTMQTTSVEALIRWHHPEFGMVPPDEFIHLAEQGDFIVEMTNWVLEEAISRCRQWHDQGYPIGVAVNLSVRNLHNERLPQYIASTLVKHGLSADFLKLEITESTLMADPQRALDTMRQLASQRLTLSIDDFGTGYSSLSYLKKLPVTELKIDKSFVMEMMNDESDRVIVHSTINLAHNLGCTVVAEGIEDEQTLHTLCALGCDIGQGYFISRPLTPEALLAWFGSSRWPVKGAAAA